MLHIKVEDKDGMKENDIVDTFSITISSSTAVGVEMAPTLYHGEYGLAQIELNFSIQCVSEFYGPLCSIHCPGGLDCDSCVPGFTGEFCQFEINDCVGVECGNGECVDEIGSYMCVCNPGYSGESCGEIDYCHNISQCEFGQCINLIDRFMCICDGGYGGELCNEIDHCFNNNCTSMHVCVNLEDSYICQCESGFTGESCDVAVNGCSEIACPDGQECVDGLSSFMCVCAEGFAGLNCTLCKLCIL